MKKMLTWVWLFQKRILKKPMFQITLLLIPALLFLLLSFNQSSDSLVKVAICPGSDEYSKNFAEELLDESNNVVSFYKCESEEQLRLDVIKGRAECGYVLPDDMKECLNEYEQGNVHGIIKVINKDYSISTKVVNEIIFGKVFSGTSYQILEGFMRDKQSENISVPGESEKMQELFSDYRVPQLMFSFEYADGKENELLNDDDNNYYMMPVRGLLSVLVMVSAMSGVLMLSDDERKGTWSMIKLSKRPGFNCFYIFMTVLLVALCSLIAIFFTGLSTDFFNEILLMGLYILLITGFCNLLRALIPNIYILCSIIPIWVLLSLVLCPVFVDLGNVIPEIRIVRLFLPTNYYLDAIYSSSMQLKMLIAAILTVAGGIAADSVRNRRVQIYK